MRGFACGRPRVLCCRFGSLLLLLLLLLGLGRLFGPDWGRADANEASDAREEAHRARAGA